jgi:hypothetical protein
MNMPTHIAKKATQVAAAGTSVRVSWSTVMRRSAR